MESYGLPPFHSHFSFTLMEICNCYLLHPLTHIHMLCCLISLKKLHLVHLGMNATSKATNLYTPVLLFVFLFHLICPIFTILLASSISL